MAQQSSAAMVDNNRLLSREFSHECSIDDADMSKSANVNNFNNQAQITKRYLVYMELPKIKIGDFHKSSCIVGSLLRFHFLLKIAEDESRPLVLQPIKAYKVPVVNVAVIHRPFIEDEDAKGPIPKSPAVKSPLIRYNQDETKDEQQQNQKLQENLVDEFATTSVTAKEEESMKQRQRRDSSRQRRGDKKRKKYFVYCELPKVAVGDYRISSVTSSELIHCHFLLKIAKDEANGQPVMQPIKKYRKPRVNFAVIHRSLIVDDEATGPIPRDPRVKSPLLRRGNDDDDDDDDDDEGDVGRGGVLHTILGFNYGAAPASKYALVSQWSLVRDLSGRTAPELVLSKANG